ncbi:MAG: UDP-3-O-(3-hydroxymyristoyl)glucosamine N-acyltransferase [Acidobacteriota bacterium]|nr:UDP-3-O-(3-hydroxymyristoyl)glucosamine N-acyltransferase [Acidobacteriota bacterium]
MKCSELVSQFGLEVIGDLESDFVILGVKPLSEAGAGDLSFLNNPKYREQAQTTGASAVLVKEPVEGCPAVQIKADDPYVTLARVLQKLYPEPKAPAGIHPAAVISPEADVSDQAAVGPNCTVEACVVIGPGTELVANVYVGANTTIGADCKLFPGVVVYPGCTIGDGVRIHANSTIGSDGFGYAQDGATHVKVPQIGDVIIEHDVEIGANTCVDRGALGTTLIGAGAKIDNQVQIAHGCTIGKGAVLVSQTGLSGSSNIGNHTVLAGKVGVVGHITVGDRILVMGDSVVTKNLDKPGRYAGNPAVPHIQYQRQLARIRQLPDLASRVKALEKLFNKEDRHGK